MSLGPAEIMVVLILALIVFGPKRLPEVGRQVGGALRELRKVQDTVQTEIRSVLDDTVGPLHHMTGHEPVPQSGDKPKELTTPEAGSSSDGSDHGTTNPATDGPEPGIDGLSGGTFS
jgi:sec-independent protein translocase protein TatA